MIKAKYTVVLKALMDNQVARAEIDKALSKYPLYTPPKAYDMVPDRQEINNRLLNHYKYREIGFETVGRFLDELEITMAEIMPYYNEMLKTVVTMADLPSPFDNVDVVETFREERSSKATSAAESASKTESTAQDSTDTHTGTETAGKTIESNTPQNVLGITAENIDNVPYADSVNFSKENASTDGSTASQSEGTTETTGNTSTSDESEGITEHTFTKKGNQGVNTYAHDMNEFRTSIIDVIDQMINDTRIQELFMFVY